MPDTSPEKNRGSHEEETSVILVRIQAYVGKLLICFRHDGKDRVGGPRQKFYQGANSFALPLDLNQLICASKREEDKWCPADFSVDALSADENGKHKYLLIEIEVAVPV